MPEDGLDYLMWGLAFANTYDSRGLRIRALRRRSNPSSLEITASDEVYDLILTSSNSDLQREGESRVQANNDLNRDESLWASNKISYSKKIK